MRLAAGAGTDMAGMILGIVDDLQTARLQRLDQLGADSLGHAHKSLLIAPAPWQGSESAGARQGVIHGV
jgi:hypothetical protein